MSMVVNDLGGKQADIGCSFHLIPPAALLAVAEVFYKGAQKYERDNWRKIPCEEHVNHAVTHMLRGLAGELSEEPHFAHAIARAIMAWEMNRVEVFAKLIGLGPMTHATIRASDTGVEADMQLVADGSLAVGPMNTPQPGYPSPIPATKHDNSKPMYIYVAGPYRNNGKTPEAVNIMNAKNIGLALKSMGHHPLVPHKATEGWEQRFTFDQIMETDYAYLERYANALYRIPGPSEGADLEVAFAKRRGYPVYTSLADVPDLRCPGM